MNGNEVIEALKSGHLKAFERVFMQYYASLVNYSNSLVKDPDEAEDIVQQVFVNIWQKREAIDIHSSEKAFLYRSVYNASLNRLKQQAVRNSYARDAQFVNASQVAHTDTSSKELQQQIDKALEQLPEQCRRIFKMSRLEHMKYQQIADELGLSIKTVENQMGKALKLLRELLKDYLVLYIILFAS